MEVKYIKSGTGNRVGNTIYLNEELKLYPELHNAILCHEKKHTGGFTWWDLKLDLTNKELKNLKKEYYSFILNHPRALLNFFPIMKLNKQWTYDLSLIFLWTFVVVIGVIGWILI